VGALGAGYWIAHASFWILLLLASGELGRRWAATFVFLWLIGYAGSSWLPQGSILLMSYVALLDVALVLLIFKGDLRLT
jgi:hypothetical protein